MAGRPVKVALTKNQELAYISIKPETITKFKVGATKDGQIVALVHEIHISVGAQDADGHSSYGAFQEPTRALHRQGAELEIHLVRL